MGQERDRLRRLLETELEDCCAADVEDRLSDLAAIEDALPDSMEADRAALGALGDETRHRILRLLVAAPADLCVCELEALVEVSPSAISHALSDLADVGLVSRRKEGTWRYYSATERAVAIVDTLEDTRAADAAQVARGEP